MATTRLGLAGITRAPYGSFAGKTAETANKKLLKIMRGASRGVAVGMNRGVR